MASSQPLSKVAPGQRVIVQRVSDDQSELLRYLAELGLIPGALVEVEAVSPYGGVSTVRVGQQTHALGETVTQAVLVRPVTPDSQGVSTPSANPLEAMNS